MIPASGFFTAPDSGFHGHAAFAPPRAQHRIIPNGTRFVLYLATAVYRSFLRLAPNLIHQRLNVKRACLRNCACLFQCCLPSTAQARQRILLKCGCVSTSGKCRTLISLSINVLYASRQSSSSCLQTLQISRPAARAPFDTLVPQTVHPMEGYSSCARSPSALRRTSFISWTAEPFLLEYPDPTSRRYRRERSDPRPYKLPVPRSCKHTELTT